MASQKHANGCIAAIAFAASTYSNTPHCSAIVRFALGAFCLVHSHCYFDEARQALVIRNPHY
jgi:hypothetical protein